MHKTPEPRVPTIYILTATTPPPGPHTSIDLTLVPSHSCRTHTTTVHASQSPQQLTTYGTTTTSQTDQGLPQDYKHNTITQTQQ